MIIKNFEKLAHSPLRSMLLKIAESGYEAIRTDEAISSQVHYNFKKNLLKVEGKTFSLEKYKRIFILAFGKAATDSAEALKKILGSKIHKAFVVDVCATPDGKERCQVDNFTYFEATHPKVSEKNVRAAAEILSELSELSEHDLVLCSTSGGGSAIFEMPYKTEASKAAEIFTTLTKAGATISELNTVRKHISLVKGGQLAKALFPATVINLLFSDVPGNDISVIASGPLVMDKTTIQDAKNVLTKFNALDTANVPKCELIETPKEKKYFKNVYNFLIVSPEKALKAMGHRAEELGFSVKIFSSAFQGEARSLGPKVLAESKKGQCLLGAGESTVKILGKGVGGRNQEMALSALSHVRPGQVFGCFASDGHDNSEAAGAVVDEFTLNTAKKLNLDYVKYLNNNDSFNFFDQVGSMVITGLTGSNVADFFICLQK